MIHVVITMIHLMRFIESQIVKIGCDATGLLYSKNKPWYFQHYQTYHNPRFISEHIKHMKLRENEIQSFALFNFHKTDFRKKCLV